MLPADNPLFYSYLAVALEMGGKTEEALVAAQKAAELGQDSPRLESRVAWVLYMPSAIPKRLRPIATLIKKYDGEFKAEEIRQSIRNFAPSCPISPCIRTTFARPKNGSNKCSTIS